MTPGCVRGAAAAAALFPGAQKPRRVRLSAARPPGRKHRLLPLLFLCRNEIHIALRDIHARHTHAHDAAQPPFPAGQNIPQRHALGERKRVFRKRLRAHKADLRRKYRYAERENERRIDAVTARQEAERENQKKLYKRYEDFLKLINFVKYIEDDSFWRAEIVQIVAVTISNGDVEVELVPRTGDHTVLFGAIEDVEEKFDKLLAFYRNGLENIGWEEYRTISVKYKGQVVCRK